MALLSRFRKRDRDEQRGLAHREHQEEQGGLSRFRHEMEKALDRVWREFDRDPWAPLSQVSEWPAMDVAEDEQKVTLRLDVPGLDAKDLDIQVSGTQLTVKGSRQDEWEDTKQGIHRRERRSGSFTRTVTLPSYVDPNQIEARYDKGTLTLTVPKIPGQGPKRVQVTT